MQCRAVHEGIGARHAKLVGQVPGQALPEERPVKGKVLQRLVDLEAGEGPVGEEGGAALDLGDFGGGWVEEGRRGDGKGGKDRLVRGSGNDRAQRAYVTRRRYLAMTL